MSSFPLWVLGELEPPANSSQIARRMITQPPVGRECPAVTSESPRAGNKLSITPLIKMCQKVSTNERDIKHKNHELSLFVCIVWVLI